MGRKHRETEKEKVIRRHYPKENLAEGTVLRSSRGSIFEVVVRLPNGSYYIQHYFGVMRIKSSREFTPANFTKCKILRNKSKQVLEAMSLCQL